MRKINTILNGLTFVVIIGFTAVIALVMISIAVIQRDTASTGQVYQVEEVLLNPLAFHNTTICLYGNYKGSWKESALGRTYVGQEAEAIEGMSDKIWVNVTVPESGLACSIADDVKTCSGPTVACGKFIMDERGLGYQNEYLYGIY